MFKSIQKSVPVVRNLIRQRTKTTSTIQTTTTSNNTGLYFVAGGWTAFLLENIVLSENREWLCEKYGEENYHLGYNTLSSTACLSILYGYMKHKNSGKIWSKFTKGAAPLPLRITSIVLQSFTSRLSVILCWVSCLWESNTQKRSSCGSRASLGCQYCRVLLVGLQARAATPSVRHCPVTSVKHCSILSSRFDILFSHMFCISLLNTSPVLKSAEFYKWSTNGFLGKRRVYRWIWKFSIHIVIKISR